MPNLSQLKRERMLAFLQKIKDEHRDDDDMLIALGEIESELTSKKYGLVWEQHEEAVDVMMRDNVPVFTEVPEREITAAPGQGYNFILEGDNLHSLRLLEKTHKGKIDIIYIDPPYNRGGNDFRYEDTFVEKQDGFRHSKWLSFMESRLRIAWQLLKSDGVIFISIDDFEMGALRMLCDDVFGEAFFLCNIVWQKRYSRENREAIGDAHEYILVYAKDKLKFKENAMKSEFEVYMETGNLGGYIPERVFGYRDDFTITPTSRDTSYHETERGMELRREMIVGGRKFFVRSIFSTAEKAKTPTEQMLQIIDSDLGKGSI